MKKILALILAVASLASFTACSSSSDTAEETAALTEITVCLDWTPNTNHTGLYVAVANGYYADAGLDVTLVQPPEDGAEALVAAGQADFAVSAQDTLVGAFTGENPLDIVAVAALLQHNTSGIISRAGEGMDTAAGLEGKRYSTWNIPSEIAMIEQVVEADGGDFSLVELIPNVITDEVGALTAEQTDAVWVFYGWSGINAEIQGFDADFFYFKDIDPVMDCYTPILVSSSAYLSENEDTAKAFLAATAMGYEYAIENPAEAAQILIDGDDTGSLAGAEELVLASQDYMVDQYKAEADQWGYITPERWDGFYGWLFEEGLIETALDAGTGYTNDYLS